MSVAKVKDVDGAFLLSKQLVDKGFHTFDVAKTSGNVQVTSSKRVSVALGDGENGKVLDQGTGTYFTIGADQFDKVSIECFIPNTSIALRLVNSQVSNAAAKPSWWNQIGYVIGGNDKAGSRNGYSSKWNALSRTWSVATTATRTNYESRGISNKGVAGYITAGDFDSVQYTNDLTKMDYATETWSDLSEASAAGSWRGRDRHATFWSRGVAGYATHGYTSAALNTADKIDYTTEVCSRISNAGDARGLLQSFHHTTNNTGYAWGGIGTATEDEWNYLDMTTEVWGRATNQGSARRDSASIVEDGVAAYTTGHESYTSDAITRHLYGLFTGVTVAYIPKKLAEPVPISFKDHGVWAAGWNGDERNYTQVFEYGTDVYYVGAYWYYNQPTGVYGGANANDGGMPYSHRKAAGFWDV